MNIQVNPFQTLSGTNAPPTRSASVAVAFGDGVGPEIMNASLRILLAAGADLEIEPIDVGERVYKAGQSSGIGPDAWESIRRTGVLYKAPITTPQGGGYKSLNVTIRKSLGLFANVRPAVAYSPFVATQHPGMDLVVIRENEEDLYAGIEHRQTDEVYQCLKLITRPGCEKIVRYAFEYARAHRRKKVSCFTKDNIMKLTDGLFHSVFDEIAAEYPEIAADHAIVDIGAARLAADPGRFDVLVMPNLYGDILSDVAAEIVGSVGMAPSANIGQHCAMFEAIHGSAPDIAGKGVANPSGLLLAGVMMLVHLGRPEAAARVHNAWLRTIEQGRHTPDIFDPDISHEQLGTAEFASAVIENLGREPDTLPAVAYVGAPKSVAVTMSARKAPARKDLVGVDVFLHALGQPDEIADRVLAAGIGPFELSMITNRGVKVWPEGMPETFCTDHWRCRFKATAGQALSSSDVIGLLRGLADAKIDFIKTEHLYDFDGQPGYSLGQGQ